jgi:aspartate carbamoyltransferase catalytic subunit
MFPVFQAKVVDLLMPPKMQAREIGHELLETQRTESMLQIKVAFFLRAATLYSVLHLFKHVGGEVI